jgi:hypothetical protein
MKSPNEFIDKLFNVEGKVFYNSTNQGDRLVFIFSTAPLSIGIPELFLDINPDQNMMLSFPNQREIPIIPFLSDLDESTEKVRKNLETWSSKKYHMLNNSSLIFYENMIQKYSFLILIRRICEFTFFFNNREISDLINNYKNLGNPKLIDLLHSIIPGWIDEIREGINRKITVFVRQ